MMAVERAAASNTLAAYARDLADARGFLAGRGRDLTDAGLDDIEAYFADLGARGLAVGDGGAAARRRARALPLRLDEGWRADDPSRRVDAPKTGRPLPKVLSREEVDRLIAAAGARDGAAGPAPRLHGRAALRLGPADLGAARRCRLPPWRAIRPT